MGAGGWGKRGVVSAAFHSRQVRAYVTGNGDTETGAGIVTTRRGQGHLLPPQIKCLNIFSTPPREGS